MTKDIQLGITTEFRESVKKLPRAVQNKVWGLVWYRMVEDPWDSNHHPEKVKSARDDRIWSARVDDNYRLIWAHVQVRGKPDQVIFLYVDKHDAAYKKAGRMKFKVKDGIATIIDLVETATEAPPTTTYHSQPKSASPVGNLFVGYRDQELLDCGVPEDLLPAVRRLDTENELDELARRLPEGVYDNLIAMLLGEPELVQVPNAQLHRSLEKYHGGDNLHLFVNSEEFKRALEGNWEDWMLFLAPHQRRLVYADYAGPARVKGVAGSGKTVVAIHRALHLSRNLKPGEKILLLTYGNRLPGVMQYLLEKLAGKPAEALGIECKTIHQWCYRFLSEHGEIINVGQRSDFSSAIQAGIASARRLYPVLRIWQRDEQFFQDEIRYAIKGRAIATFEDYAALERSGRGTALSETERKAMWQVYLGYQKYLQERGLWDYDDYILKSLDLLRGGKKPGNYRTAVVDEIQDLNAATMLLIRALVPPGSNDLFLVGDGLQKLYPGGYVLGKLGIDIVGRGTILRRNYRNTQQILRAAYAMVENMRFNDLDENDTVAEPPEYSPREGALPLIKGFSYPEDEVSWVKQEIERLTRQQGFGPGDFAILYRWRSPYKGIIHEVFSGQTIEITKDYVTYFAPLVKHTTFDSAKGLEFKIVFLVGVTDGIMVPKDDWSLKDVALEEYLARERSRLFVAMTRARDLLYITYSRGQISRFLNGVPEEYFEHK